MNIGILISDFTRRAGTERAVANLAAMLVRQGHETTICSVYSASGSSSYILPPEVKMIHGGLEFSHGESLFQKIRRKIAFVYFLKSLDFEILIGTETSFNILLFLAKSAKRIGCEHINYGFAPVHLNLFRWLAYRFLDAVVLLTGRDAQQYTFVKKGKLFIIPNSLPFEIPPATLHDSKEILAIGRLTRQKGFDMLLSAAGKIRDQHADWHITIVGDGEDKEKLLQQIQNNNLMEFVSLMSATTDVWKYYQRAAIYAMTSRWEGFPMVLLEAQAFGLPIVSFDCPEGPAEIVHDGRDGFLVEANHCTQLADKINELIENTPKRIAFGAAARKNAEKYSRDAVAVLWTRLLAALKKDDVDQR